MYIITSASIDYVLPGYDLYDSFDVVSKGEADAPLSTSAKEEVKNAVFPFDVSSVTTLLAPPHGQALATAHLLIATGRTPHAEIVQTSLLEGVRFSMHSLISKEAFLALPYEQAIAKARSAFVEKLYRNELTESFSSVTSRIQTFIDSYGMLDNDHVAISHGFYMKLLYLYHTNPSCFNDVTTLRDAFTPEVMPYGRLEGFELSNGK